MYINFSRSIISTHAQLSSFQMHAFLGTLTEGPDPALESCLCRCWPIDVDPSEWWFQPGICTRDCTVSNHGIWHLHAESWYSYCWNLESLKFIYRTNNNLIHADKFDTSYVWLWWYIWNPNVPVGSPFRPSMMDCDDHWLTIIWSLMHNLPALPSTRWPATQTCMCSEKSV